MLTVRDQIQSRNLIHSIILLLYIYIYIYIYILYIIYTVGPTVTTTVVKVVERK
jgi:hypothetical protein